MPGACRVRAFCVVSRPVEESWDQIGVRLKQAREKAEMTVDDVVFRARIPRSVVEALEAEDFSVFTSPTYAKSFLRQYSEFLGVDADPWLNALEPAAYVSGNGLPMFSGLDTSPAPKRASETRQAKPESEPDTRGKWSAVWVMFLTAALVISIIKGYQTFEEKFGGESASSKVGSESNAQEPKREETAPKPESVTTPAAHAQENPAAGPQPENPEPPAPPPRALIIRE